MVPSESHAVSPGSLPLLLLLLARRRTNACACSIGPSVRLSFWLEPTISLASYEGLRTAQLKELQAIVEERHDDIKEAWRRHFAR